MSGSDGTVFMHVDQLLLLALQEELLAEVMQSGALN